MKIDYRELSTFKEYRKCAEIQKEIFGFSETDASSPLYINTLSRKSPKMGIVVGAFLNNDNEDEELVGFFIGAPTFINKSLFGVLLGVLPQYQKYGIGIQLFLKVREIALSFSLKYFLALIDPLDKSISNIYFSLFDSFGFSYKSNAFIESDNEHNEEKSLPNDRLMLVWLLDSETTKVKLERKYKKRSFKDVLQTSVIVTDENEDYHLTGKSLLIEIPLNFSALQLEDAEAASSWRLKTRSHFEKYLNHEGYVVTGLYSEGIRHNKKLYYLLEKNENEQMNEFFQLASKYL